MKRKLLCLMMSVLLTATTTIYAARLVNPDSPKNSTRMKVDSEEVMTMYNIFKSTSGTSVVVATLYGSEDGGITWFLMGSQSNFNPQTSTNNFTFKIIFTNAPGNSGNSFKFNGSTSWGTASSSGSAFIPLTGSGYTLYLAGGSTLSNKTVYISWTQELIP